MEKMNSPLPLLLMMLNLKVLGGLFVLPYYRSVRIQFRVHQANERNRRGSVCSWTQML